MTIEVKIWETLVGLLSWDDRRSVGVFEFDRNFIKTGLNLSPLIIPTPDEKKVYSFPPVDEEARITYKGLPAFIADSLPDSFGNKVIDEWLLQQGRTIEIFSVLERLGYTGKRGLGALEFYPSTANMDEIVDVNIIELISLAQGVFAKRSKFHANATTGSAAIKDIVRVGASAGGARPKAVIAYNEATGEIKSGQIAEIPEGFEHYLLKLDGVTKSEELGLPTGMGRVEYAYYKMATDSGITMAECRLLEEGGRAHFMTRRFDRPGGGEKLHMQTICALANMNFRLKRTHSYERVFFTLNRLKLPYTAIEQQFRRMVFNVVAKNCDDHTKNISFLMNKEGEWSLAPAYDISYAYDPTGEWNRCHLLSVNGKFEDFTLKDLEKTGQEQSIKNCKHIIAQICDVVSRWPEYAKAAGVDKSLYESIAKAHEIVA